jgi:hypothetical protein
LLERNPIISQALWSSLYLDKLHAVRAVFKEEELMSHTLWINNIIAAQTIKKPILVQYYAQQKHVMLMI